MSVLSFPRIYFTGLMEWDPCTFNNNDWQNFPTYDAANAALNWDFLATQGPAVPPGITQDNFTTLFRPWAITLQQDNNPNDAPAGRRVPTEWNMFGTHSVNFVQYEDLVTTVTGGDLAYGQPSAGDPLIGGPIVIGPDSTSSAARLVDINPASFWSSQIYYGQLAFGSGNYQITGPRNFRMHSRWLNLNRIYNADPALTQPAASVACCFQACIPYEQVGFINIGSTPSALIAQLKEAAAPPALGIMMRFTAYVNVYFKNGVLNDKKIAPGDYEALAGVLALAWKEWQTNGGSTKLFFSNPCYSHVVGALGVWNPGELATVPVGRYLSCANSVAPPGPITARPAVTAARGPFVQQLGHHTSVNLPVAAATPATDAAPAPQAVPLGPVVAEVDGNAGLISLDFNSTMPENGTPPDGTLGAWPSDLTKTDFGPLVLGVQDTGGTFTPIASITYDQYQQSAYQASAGIIDILFPDSGTATLLQSGALAIQVQGTTALLEQVYSAQTDSRGIYVDQSGQAEFNVTVYLNGTPCPGAILRVAQYDAGLNLVPSTEQPLVSFTNGDWETVKSAQGDILTNVTMVTAGPEGIATVGIAAVVNGFPTLAFLPYAADGPATAPQDSLNPPGPPNTPGWGASITYAFYTTVRVLPFDDALPQQFVDLWNNTHDPAQAWTFIYSNILYLYDQLFNVMLEFVNLGSQQDVTSAIQYIWPAISADYAQEATGAMPITRDLSAGKRLTLQLWMYVISGPSDGVSTLFVNSIPPGWTPPTPSKPSH